MTARELIFEALETLKIDQAGLAKRLGVGQPTVSRWLSGESNPDFESCLRLAKITGMPARRVLEAAGRDPELIPPPDQADEHDAALAEVRRRRREAYEDVDRWLAAVGPEYETDYWNHLKAQAQATVLFMSQIRTAVNAGSDAAVNAAVSRRGKRGRISGESAGGPLSPRQRRASVLLGSTRLLANRQLVA